jgi:1-acyl-sn-glycerol-3-phosphate acyltransferase
LTTARSPGLPAASLPAILPAETGDTTGTAGSDTIRPVSARRPTDHVPLPLRAWRYGRLALHLVAGALSAALVYNAASLPGRRRLRQRWSAKMLAILGIRLEVEGEPIVPGSMLVANHISWVDIFVINAVAPAAFVSKADVRGWPLIGWLAARNETVFLRRGSRGHAKIVNGEIAGILAEGGCVAVFPEGTTTDGSHVLHFHAALLQPALDAGHSVQPVALSYLGADGRRSYAPAYDGEVSLGQCLAAMVAEREITARVRLAPALAAHAATDRRTLARQTRERIVLAVDSVPD